MVNWKGMLELSGEPMSILVWKDGQRNFILIGYGATQAQNQRFWLAVGRCRWPVAAGRHVINGRPNAHLIRRWIDVVEVVIVDDALGGDSLGGFAAKFSGKFELSAHDSLPNC